MNALEQLIVSQDKPGNTIVIGDLNLDCNYDDGKAGDFESWHYLITDLDDTTTGATDCAYDRIIFNPDAFNEYVSRAVYQDILEFAARVLATQSFLTSDFEDCSARYSGPKRDIPDRSGSRPKQNVSLFISKRVRFSPLETCGEIKTDPRVNAVAQDGPAARPLASTALGGDLVPNPLADDLPLELRE